MSALLPAAVYGLSVPAGDIAIRADAELPAAFRITKAAIDPSAEPEFAGSAINSTTPRATLKLIRQPLGMGDYSDSEEDNDDELRGLLNGSLDDSDDDEDDEETNGGPSDPAKGKKAREEAAKKALKEALQETIDKEGLTNGVNGADAKSKGKAIANGDEDIDMSDESDLEEEDIDEYVICTLDPNQHYQESLDITIGEKERIFFKVSGTHTIHLTGNYVMPVDDTPRGYAGEGDSDSEDEEDMLGLDGASSEDELDGLDDSESDELDDIEDPRVTEVSDEEEEEAPKLIKSGKSTDAKATKKNKRSADEIESDSLDAIIEKSIKAEPTANGDVKLSKKQLKKLKNNAGQPVATATETETKTVKKDESPGGKKVQFAKVLEQGPTGTTEPAKSRGRANKDEPEAKSDKKEKKSEEEDNAKGTGAKKGKADIRMVKGVGIEDREPGKGPGAKKGKTVRVRYIGKLKTGLVFDANKKGPPYTFKLGIDNHIAGWDIGMEGLRKDGQRRITIPASLGYGAKAQPKIPANSELIFDIKCLGVD